MEEVHGWTEDFAELRRHVSRVGDASHDLADWLRAQLPSDAVPASIVALQEEISKAQSLTNQLSDRLSSGPLRLLDYGLPMSREAFYLLVASGVLWFEGSGTGDPHADFQMLRYEDDERRCYICLDPLPAPGALRVHIGMRPEEIEWERLRSEQRDFFDRHMPAIAVRFKRKA